VSITVNHIGDDRAARTERPSSPSGEGIAEAELTILDEKAFCLCIRTDKRMAIQITDYQTLKVRFEEKVCFIQLYRPQADNTINSLMIGECLDVMEECRQKATLVVLEGLPEVFCLGADFQSIHDQIDGGSQEQDDPERIYRLWLQLANGPYVTVAHVKGRANAGGVGFLAACDIVLAASNAQFSLSEMLFGLFPACVMPFLIRRVGMQKAHYLTLMTKPIDVQQAHGWGLVDAFDTQSDKLLRIHLRRLKCLSKTAISRYKDYLARLNNQLSESMSLAVQTNRKLFSDADNLARIHCYIETGRFPWDE
jgi:polyketide biosynthesis enoyl-CoA hydratase PksH